MVSGSRWTIGWACVALMCGCGGADARPEQTSPTPAQVVAATPEPPTAPPAVRLVWQPGGELSVENADSGLVSLRRQVDVQGLPEETELTLAVTCEPPPDHPCITLTSGAAVRLGRWPDDLGACRCHPCLDAPSDPPGDARAPVTMVLHGCEPTQELALSIPPH